MRHRLPHGITGKNWRASKARLWLTRGIKEKARQSVRLLHN
jgi:hypothetical protein